MQRMARFEKLGPVVSIIDVKCKAYFACHHKSCASVEDPFESLTLICNALRVLLAAVSRANTCLHFFERLQSLT
jgi:hypothetical protein